MALPRLTADEKVARTRRAEISAASAKAEYDASQTEQDQKTARLRALRRERDDALAAEEAAKPPVPAKPVKKKTKRHVVRG